ncbi:MAG TPA: hypothetical protein DGP25_02845 [Brevundimonas sp.]|nr:hypothetical protein [Brevundimonas sp.]
MCIDVLVPVVQREHGGSALEHARSAHLEDDMSRTPNDDRSDSMNPNNDAYWSSLDNHSNQLNPNNEAYEGPPVTEDEE